MSGASKQYWQEESSPSLETNPMISILRTQTDSTKTDALPRRNLQAPHLSKVHFKGEDRGQAGQAVRPRVQPRSDDHQLTYSTTQFAVAVEGNFSTKEH